MLGIEHPILLAPMAMVSGGKLAAAVSRAGGLGLIGGGYGDADFLEEQFSLARGHTVGVGFITWSLAKKPSLLDLALSYHPAAVMLSFGDMTPFAKKIHSTDALLIAQVQTVAQAIEAKNLGADLVVAQGSEAGGHGSLRATLPLVPAVVDQMQDTPVIAAGGIADGRGLAASLALGACGVLMGSRFYVSEESLAAETAKQIANRSSGDETVRSQVFDRLRGFEWPAPYQLRTLPNRSTVQWHDRMAALEKVLDTERVGFKQAVDQQDYNRAPVIVGEAVDLINRSQPAEHIVRDCIKEAVARLQSGVQLISDRRPDGIHTAEVSLPIDAPL